MADQSDAPPPPNSQGGKKHIHMKPNQADFVDKNGVKHWIHGPRGQWEEVLEHMNHRNWEALLEYPVWTGAADQQYTEEDYYTPTDIEKEEMRKEVEEKKKVKEGTVS